jgi:hypothetical protein
MSEVKQFSLVKPSLQTPFCIDFDWWKQHDNNWRVHLQSSLCPEHREAYIEDAWVDWVDPKTGEVQLVDGLQNILMTHCAKQSDFLTDHTTLVDAAFRILLANGNVPLTAIELAEKMDKPANTILRTLSGKKVYKGLRPCQS